jgi:hypothetical protein
VSVQIAQPETVRSCGAVADLLEDRLTAWAPDVAGDADLPYLAEHPAPASGPELMAMDVPTPGGGAMRVPVLHPSLLISLHEATSPLRVSADALLAPGVLGYRRGAQAGWHYAPAWREFSDEVTRLSRSHRWVAFTDVSSFFASTTWEAVLAATQRLFSKSCAQELTGLTQRFRASGQHTLPSGYADARFLSNLVLSEVDEQLGVPFVRWVDDYRIFGSSERQVRGALTRAHAAMRGVGLRPNESKTRIVPGTEAAARSENTLASVYHPERDSREVVQANLRRVLARACEDPVRRRQDLRFVLSRLARERDPAAVSWAIDAVSEIPWEAPRLVAYLAVFDEDELERPRIRAGVERLLRDAASAGDAWLFARLVPLCWESKIEERTAGEVQRSLDCLAGTPAWGLALRLLARAGDERTVRAAATPAGLDRRGLLAAFGELEYDPPGWLCDAEPRLASAIRDGHLAPPPQASLL